MTAPLSIAVPFPVFQDRDGQPLENGYIWLGVPNLNPQTNPIIAYYDDALTIVAPQPLRTLNGYISNAGTPAQVYVDGVNFSILVQDSKGSMVYNFPEGTGISADACGVTYNPPFVGAVAYPVCEKLEQTVSVKDFGAVGDGVTDDTVAIQAAVNAVNAAGGGTVLFPEPSVSYRITATINLFSFITLQGQSKDTKIFRDFVNGFAILATDKIQIAIDSLWIYSTTPSTTSPSGGIGFQRGELNTVTNVNIVGMRQYGVWIYDSSYNTVDNCRFSGWIGVYQQDSCDVAILNDAKWNTVSNNKCFGGGDHGILIQDTYAGAEPTGNKAVGNYVGEHTAYGIAVYVTNNFNTKTQVINNDVRDILGTSLSGASGAGIYIQSAGGTICSGNVVSNCCRSTTNFFTLSPGAIGISTPSGTPAYPTTVSNNSLDSIRGPCIAAITNGGPVNITNNNCTLDCADTAANPSAIYVSNSPRCTISNNVINHTSPNPALYVIARSAVIINDIAILNNSVKASERGIFLNRVDTATFESLRMIGNYVEGPNVQSVQILFASSASIIGNIIYGSEIVFELNNSIRSRMEGNSLISSNTSTPVIFFVGTNTGSIFSETNTIVGRVNNNSGSGVIVSQYGSTAPIGGNNWNVSDRVIQSVSVVGNPKGWRCTVAGNPGTWVSEGNL